jgi:CBS domain containing-hemolysin-like protein
VTFVGPHEPAASLLRLFVDQHEHLAVVRDGAHPLGLVTFE